MNDGQGVVFCGHRSAAAHGNPEVAITCTIPVQDEAIPDLSMERGDGHNIQPSAEELASLRMFLQRGSMGTLKSPRLLPRL